MIFAICFCSDGSVTPGSEDEPTCLPRIEPLEGVDMQPDERLRRLRRDLLDVDSALRREHEEGLLDPAIECQRKVVLLGDIGCLLDPEALDDMTFDVEPDDVLRVLLRLVGCCCASLTPPALPRPPVST